jgi:hypothetical protein
MKHKVSELEGALLDAAVAKALGWVVETIPEDHGGGLSALDVEHQRGHILTGDEYAGWSPSRLWGDGGPIIERDRIEVSPLFSARTRQPVQGWSARLVREMYADALATEDGPTPLIAAMRTKVASVYGEEVELP